MRIVSGGTGVGLLAWFWMSGVAAGADPRLIRIADAVRASADVDDAMRVMRGVWERDRWFTFPKFRETSDYLAAEMRRQGFRDVRVIGAPADGRTQFGYWTMPMAWDVRSATLVLSDGTVLADYSKVPASLCMWSGPTPTSGLEAEIVWLKDARADGIRKSDLRGKFVLTDVNPAGIKWLLVKQGAAGAINAFTENRALRNDRQWVNAWGDKGWGFLKNDTPMPCFSITPAQSERLKQMLSQGPVRAKANVDARLYEGEYPYVTGMVQGATEEEVLTLGHTAEQGAHDNATGVAAMVGALSALNKLIATGKLAKPRRSIRMLAMGELYGTMHYLANARKAVAAIALDTPAAPYEMAGTEYTFHLNPHAAASYVDALILKTAEAHLSRLSPPRPFHAREFTPGTDAFLGEPMIGIETVWPYSGTGVHTHHNSADTPETVDPRSLRDLIVIAATYLYAIASAGEGDIEWLAGMVADRADLVIREAATEDWRTAEWKEGSGMGRALYDAQEQVTYRKERSIAAIESLLRLTKNPSLLEPAIQRVHVAARAASAALQRNADLAAKMLGHQSPVKAVAPDPDPRESEARGIVVKRKRMGSLTLDDLPQDQWQGWPSGAWGKLQQTALFWCDGKRTLPDVMRLTRLENGPSKFDFIGYFRFLEKHGYVEFAK
ncbi:MAG: M28 family peptidase [Bryobacterales bacterium]|nr:M28 family peptidase [Bryobacterales bacterium]